MRAKESGATCNQSSGHNFLSIIKADLC